MKVSVFIVCAALFFLNACGEGDEYDSSSVGYGDVPGESAEEIPRNEDYALDAQMAFVENLEEKMMALERDIGRLEYELQSASTDDDVQGNVQEQLSSLKSQYKTLETRVAELKGKAGTNGDEFDEMKADVITSWDELKQSYNRTAENIGDVGSS